jgi:hypothetical protein
MAMAMDPMGSLRLTISAIAPSTGNAERAVDVDITCGTFIGATRAAGLVAEGSTVKALDAPMNNVQKTRVIRERSPNIVPE